MPRQKPKNEQGELETKKAVSRRDAMKRMAGVTAIAALPIAAGSMSCAPYCSWYYSYSYYVNYYSEYCSMG